MKVTIARRLHVQARSGDGLRGTFANTRPDQRLLARDTLAVRAESVDPRTDAEWQAGPARDYRVVLWITRNQSSEYDLLGADDVHAAIAWADAEARARDCTYTLYAKVGGDRPGVSFGWQGSTLRFTRVRTSNASSRPGDIPEHWPRRQDLRGQNCLATKPPDRS